MKVKIANIVKDEKFIDGVIGSLSFLDDKWMNDYLLVANIKPDTYKYIKNTDRITYVSSDNIINYLIENQYNAVFLHSLPSFPIELIPQIDKKIKVFWFAWGWDIYQLPKEKPFINVNLIKSETQKELEKLKPNTPSKKKTLKDYLRPLKYFFCESPTNKRIKNYYKAIKRINYFSGVLEYEYELMKSVKGFRADRVSFKYVSYKSSSEKKEEQQLHNGKNILIGNSAASTNNHLDIIPYLKKLDLAERKIILPLSYSNTKEYIEDIEQAYHQNFGDNALVLKDFMPFQDYSKLILSCSIAIFFMERQQAIGNINMALLNGCKVFLSETNPVFSFYKSLGIRLYSVQQDLSQEEIDTPLSQEDIETNRIILFKRYNKEQYIKELNYIYDQINKQ